MQLLQSLVLDVGEHVTVGDGAIDRERARAHGRLDARLPLVQQEPLDCQPARRDVLAALEAGQHLNQGALSISLRLERGVPLSLALARFGIAVGLDPDVVALAFAFDVSPHLRFSFAIARLRLFTSSILGSSSFSSSRVT